MMQRTKNLIGRTVHAVDGPVGKLEDYYLESGTWLVRFLVVKSSQPEHPTHLLVPPECVDKIDEERRIRLTMGSADVMGCPMIELDAHQNRVPGALRETTSLWLAFGHLFQAPSIPELLAISHATNDMDGFEDQQGTALISFNAISGNRIEAVDGNIGRLADLIVDIDARPWSVQYFEASVQQTDGRKRVLIPAACVNRVGMDDRRIHVYVYHDTVCLGPESGDSIPVGKVFEESVYRQYGWPQHWV